MAPINSIWTVAASVESKQGEMQCSQKVDGHDLIEGGASSVALIGEQG